MDAVIGTWEAKRYYDFVRPAAANASSVEERLFRILHPLHRSPEAPESSAASLPLIPSL
jgi:hypothetical protein